MKKKIAAIKKISYRIMTLCLLFLAGHSAYAQTLAFPGAGGFGRYAMGARAAAAPSVYIVTNLNDSGPGSFRDAVSQPGRVIVFAVGGIIYLQSDIGVAANITIAGQTAPGDGIVLFGKRVTFTNSNNTICRFLRIRLGATDNSGKDASGLANGANIILDHMSISWGMDENFSINWDNKNTSPDNITVQNSIIGQGLHRSNHSAGGLIQTPDGGRVSLIRNLYISNKTRNPKVKGVNEFVNNVVYDWGNGNRLGDQLDYGWAGEGYIMGGSSGVSEVNIINNYFVGGPLTPPSKTTPFSRGTGTFNLYGAGNFFDNNQNGLLDGAEVPYNDTGYPGIETTGFKTSPFAYPTATPEMTAEQAYSWIIDSVGACYPRRDQVDSLMAAEVNSRGTEGWYVYRETDLPFTNGGVGVVQGAPAPLDTDSDGMPDAWEDANGLNKADAQDAVAFNATYPEYLNIEVYINSLISTPAEPFIRPPSNVQLSASSVELPVAASTIEISWADNSDNEDAFQVERSDDGTTYTLVNQTAANAVTYTDNTGLIPNKTYYYRLRAVNATDSSAYSAPVSVKTPPVPTAPEETITPSPSDGYQYADLTAGALTLSWSGSSNTQKYIVFFGTDPAALTQQAEITDMSQTSYQLTGLQQEVIYYWRVDAVNDKGTTQGNVWSFRTSGTVPEGMIGYWSMDDTEELQVTDSSVYQDHGALGLDADNPAIRVEGHKKGAIDFATLDASTYGVSIPHQDQLYLDKSSFSISFWMKADPSLMPSDASTSAYLLCKGSIGTNATIGSTGKRFDLEFKNKILRFAIDDANDSGGGGKDELQTDGTPFYSGDWVHVVAIRNVEDKKLQIYLNGELVSEKSISKALSGIGEASALILGNIGERELLAGAQTPSPYRGMLDEVKMYNYVLSYADIITLFYGSALPQKAYGPNYNNTVVNGYADTLKLTWKGGVNGLKFQLFLGTDPANLKMVSDSIPLEMPEYAMADVPEQKTYYWRVDAVGALGTSTGDVWSFTTGYQKDLVAHYAFDESSGTMATDSSDFENHGTLTDMTDASWVTGKKKNALAYGTPGSTGAVVVADAPQIRFDDHSFTISMWVSLPAYDAGNIRDCYLLHKGTFESTTGKWYGIQLKDKTLTFAIDDGTTKVSAGVSVAPGSTYDIFNKGWVHIVVLRSTDIHRIRVYINGVMAKSVDETGVSRGIGKSDNLLIGNSAENKPFIDTMDDVRMYNYALSEDAINKLYNNIPLLKKVTNPSPANGSAGAGPETVTLQWTESTGTALSYNVYFGTAEDDLALVGEGVTTTSFVVDTLDPEATYYWRVKAFGEGEAVMGNVWSFTTGADVTGPEMMTKNISVDLSSSGAVSILPEDVDDGSSDEYGIDTLMLDKQDFTCDDLGDNIVTLTARDAYGNESSLTATVTVNGDKPGKPVITPGDTTICYMDRAVLNATKDEVTNRYQWLYNGTAVSSVTDSFFNAENGGAYQAIAISAQSCPSDTSAIAMVTISADTSLSVSSDVTIAKGTTTTLTATTTSGSVTWSPAIAISSTSGASVIVNPDRNTQYIATLTNALGCTVQRTVMVTVEEKKVSEYNKLLTPDGDGVNDRLVIKNLAGYPNNRLQVFDRSGKEVYRKNGYSNDWDGRVNGSVVVNGTYYFVLMIDGEVVIKGSITIIH